MAEQAGLAHLVNHKVSILGLKNGLPCDRVHWMRQDQDHHVWLYTECGLVSFSERDLSSWIAQPSHSVTITDYLDNTEGVENTAIGGWYMPQSAMTRDGRILFAMRTGLGVLDPGHLNQNALPPPVHIERITADGRGDWKFCPHFVARKDRYDSHCLYCAKLCRAAESSISLQTTGL